MSFIEDNLLLANGNIAHHGEIPTSDEEITPSLENMIVLTWLRLVNPDLPSLVKQRYGTELRSRSLASLKPEISQALDSLLEEIRTATDSKVLRATASKFRQPSQRSQYNLALHSAPKRHNKSCPLCKQAGRNDCHFLSQCTFLPAEDCSFLTKACLASSLDEEEEADEYGPLIPPEVLVDELVATPVPSARIVSRRVSTKQSPHFRAFYRQHPLKLTLDTRQNKHD